MQQTQNNEVDAFHAVDFMRQVRAKRSQEYQTDRQKYLDRARQAMEDFKHRMNKLAANMGLAQAGLTDKG